MANWEQFGRLSKLDFGFRSTSGDESAKIYANSRNNAEIIITVELLDTHEKKLDVTYDELKEQLYICHSDTGETLGSDWSISDDPNEYTNETCKRDPESPDSTLRFVYKYIFCSKQREGTEKISVGINIPRVGKFDTTHNGTSTKGKEGHKFKAPKSLEITALRPIDYSNHNNISIDWGDFEEVSNDLKWKSRLTTEGPLKEHSNGKCKRRIVYIRPKESVTGQNKFKHYDIDYKSIYNSEVSTGTIYWWWGTDEHEDCFSLMSFFSNKPFAVIGRGYGRDNYQVNLWYPRQSFIRIDGVFYVKDGSYYYKFNSDNDVIQKNHHGEDDDGAATLVLYKFIMPENKTQQYRWHDVIRNPTVKVIDFYGNEGTFQLALNDGDKFDLPGLL